MNEILIVFAVAMFVLQTMALRWAKAATLQAKLLLNGSFAFLAGLGMLVVSIFAPEFAGVSTPTLFFGFAFGILFSLTILFYNMALATGPLSYTTFYFSASMVMPAISGILFFKEPLGNIPVALGLFLLAFFLLNAGAAGKTKRDKKWPLYCFVTFLCNGGLAIVQNTQQKIVGGQAGGLMMVGFFTAALCYAALWLALAKEKRNMGEIAKSIKANMLSIVFLAVGSLGGNLLLTWLAGRVAGSYLFPLVQGSIILVVTLISVIFMKEKLSKTGWLGLGLGIAAVVVINL